MRTSSKTSVQLPTPRWRDGKTWAIAGLAVGVVGQLSAAQYQPEQYHREVGTGGVEIELVVEPVGNQAVTRSATTNAQGTIPDLGRYSLLS